MANVTISIPDELLRRAREYAAAQGTSLNGLIRRQLQRQVDLPQEAVEEIMARLEGARGDSRGRRFNREELARRLAGRGRRYLSSGGDPVADLVADRVREDAEEGLS